MTSQPLGLVGAKPPTFNPEGPLLSPCDEAWTATRLLLPVLLLLALQLLLKGRRVLACAGVQ